MLCRQRPLNAYKKHSPRPDSLWNITFKWNWRRKVDNMHSYIHFLYRKCLWQLCTREYTSDSFIYCNVRSLYNSVQLRCLWNCFLKLDTLSLAIAIKWPSILTAVVWSLALFNSSLKLLKCLKYLSFQHKSPYPSRMIINKGRQNIVHHQVKVHNI